MNESQRQAYLSALGVDGYVPRWLLPVAPAPVACAMPELALDESATAAKAMSVAAVAAVQEAAVPTASPAVGGLKIAGAVTADVLGGLGAEPVAKAPAPPAEPVTFKAPALVPRFSLSIWRITDELMVIDTRQVQLALPTDRLLGNILSALGHKPGMLPKGDVLRWPMIENSTDHQGEVEAREMIHAFLDAHLMTKPAKHLLLMGEEAARYILPAEHSAEETDNEVMLSKLQGRAIEIPELTTTAIVTHSLAALLQEPILKADTWRAIQPLRLQTS